MRVLHITNLYPTSNNFTYGTFIKDQIDSLRNIGMKCDIIFIDARTKGKFQYLKKIKEIRARAKENDLIHCHHTYSAIVTLCFANVSKPTLTSFLCPAGKEGKSNRFYHIKKTLHNYVKIKSTACIVKDNPQNNSACSKKTHYIPNGVDLSFFHEIRRNSAYQKLKIKPRDYILFCSSSDHFRKEKRYDIFKETIEILKNIYHQDVEELILRNQPRKIVPYYFNASRIHLLTSDYEGSPNSVKEALACNIPVVSTDVGNVKLMLKSVKGCHISKQNDPYELARLANDSLNFRRIKGRERLVNLQLDKTSVAYSIKKIYSSILAEKCS